jgi:hypothetical protein
MKSTQEGATLPQSGYSLARITTGGKARLFFFVYRFTYNNNLRYRFYIYYIYYAKRNKQRRKERGLSNRGS